MAKLSIKSYKDEKFSSSIGDMDVIFSPSSLSSSHGIDYNDDALSNRSASDMKYKGTAPETLSFEILFDQTGGTTNTKPVKDLVKKFKELTYDYVGDTHQTPYVNIIWAEDLNFKGRLKSLDIKHLLFDPNGISLRARLSVSFTNSVDLETEAKKSDRQSPDLTHVRTVKSGDSLPLMCHDIYGDSSRYLSVAKINGLSNFRKLEPGTEIVFPPIQ